MRALLSNCRHNVFGVHILKIGTTTRARRTHTHTHTASTRLTYSHPQRGLMQDYSISSYYCCYCIECLAISGFAECAILMEIYFFFFESGKELKQTMRSRFNYSIFVPIRCGEWFGSHGMRAEWISFRSFLCFFVALYSADGLIDGRQYMNNNNSRHNNMKRRHAYTATK